MYNMWYYYRLIYYINSKLKILIGEQLMIKKYSQQREALGLNIKIARIRKKLKQYELADKLGVTANYITLIESGRKNPSLTLLWELENILDVSITKLLSHN